jgi:hypothetical protein
MSYVILLKKFTHHHHRHHTEDLDLYTVPLELLAQHMELLAQPAVLLAVVVWLVVLLEANNHQYMYMLGFLGHHNLWCNLRFPQYNQLEYRTGQLLYYRLLFRL